MEGDNSSLWANGFCPSKAKRAQKNKLTTTFNNNLDSMIEVMNEVSNKCGN
jgi:hypothetical protein